MNVAPLGTSKMAAASAAHADLVPATEPKILGLRRLAPDWSQDRRLGGLHRFAAAITLLNIIGHGFLGFETSWLHPIAALATGYTIEILLELIDARTHRRPLRFLGGGRMGLVNFLLSAHISGLAVSMLLYPNQRLMPVVFATAAAMGSKVVFRAAVDGRMRHVMNPSNFGISLTLLLFPWVGIAPPYQFTENVAGAMDWVIPIIIICSGTFLNFRFTSRLPLLGAWLAGFVAQAAFRTVFLEATLLPSLALNDRPFIFALYLLHGHGPSHDTEFGAQPDRVRSFGGGGLRCPHGLSYCIWLVLFPRHRLQRPRHGTLDRQSS